jgi:hypothetical protein
MNAPREQRERELLELMLHDPPALRRQYEQTFGEPADADLSNVELIKRILAHEHAGEAPSDG